MTFSSSFQMVSLLHLAEITEEGVTFQSPVDGSRMLLTPEESIQIQNRLGADIIMALDDVVPATMQVGCLGVERCGDGLLRTALTWKVCRGGQTAALTWKRRPLKVDLNPRPKPFLNPAGSCPL